MFFVILVLNETPFVMTRPLILVVTAMLFMTLSGQAQTCADGRYLTEIFDELTIDTVLFGEGPNIQGAQQQLYMDIYRPVGDTVTSRPVIVFAFGGGFLQGDRWEKHVTKTCKRFAKAGYVAVAMDYRYGIDFIGGISKPDEEAMRVFFRPMQDMRAAVQYMKYSVDSLNNQYGVNPDMIFVGGASSGGITALNMAYVNTAAELQQLADTSAINGLGGFNSTSANGPHAAYGWQVQGAISIAGALPKKEWLNAGEPPVILAHGDADDVVPYEDENTLNGVLLLAGVKLEGSYLVDEQATAQGVCSYLYTMPGEDHPGNGKSDYYFENIYHRIMPRLYAIINGESYCCPLSVTITGDTLRGVATYTDTVELDIDIQNSNGAASILWTSQPCTFASGQETVAVNPQPDPMQYFAVTVQEGNCLATDYMTFEKVDSVVGVDQPALAANWRMYPNPNTGTLYIQGEGSISDLKVYDLSGRLAFESASATAQLPIDISMLSKGYYVVDITTDKGKERMPLLIQ